MTDGTITAPRLALEDRLYRVCSLVAPLWPLRDFVAVNPFLGLAGQSFSEAAQTLRRVAGRDLLPRVDPSAPAPAASTTALTVADVVDSALGTDWTRRVTDEIGKWCAAWCDEGQAAWPMPWRDLPFFAAWRQAVAHDRAPEAAGLSGFRAVVASLPGDPVGSIAASLEMIGLAPREADDYLHRALLSVSGWAGLFRQKGWARELAGERDDSVLNLLAVRVAWDAALYALHEAPRFRSAWEERIAAQRPPAADLSADLARVEAREAAFRRRIIAGLRRVRTDREAPAAQAVFCIDVRSEVFRRALEAVAPEVETLGFAGFFGFAIEHVPFGESMGAAQCPVLLRPNVTICERVATAAPEEAERIAQRLSLSRQVADLWAAFRASAVSCFAYVEAAGLASAAGLLRGLLRRPAGASALAKVAPDLTPREWRGRSTGIAPALRVDMAEAVLRAMSLTEGFGGIVLLVGHGARTVNNPHAAGLDCGACGGHSGESNARVAAAVLNDPLVRRGLAERGIAIPADTWFLAALHETVTDEITLFDADGVPPSQAGTLAMLQRSLAAASARARAERAPLLGLVACADAAADTARRAADWSEVRPEWALANNAAFIAAPRARTRGLDLGGRAFLHSYDWRQDEGFGVLELIMTAPMVVANWINLQYWGSTVDNEAWGSGNKVLHNVVGLVGVLEGQGGDLRTGLPWQSVHDGKRFVHEPLRLSVFIEAPEEAMDGVLAKHEPVRQLVENAWLHLLSIRPDGTVAKREPDGSWRVEAPEAVAGSA
jgi:uncharacterized protein YbcC (UPF0753/DUF2309 family)